jgi:hypothetical protein
MICAAIQRRRRCSDTGERVGEHLAAPLRTRTAVTAPWNLRYLTAGAAATVTGGLLLSDSPLRLPAMAIGAIAGDLATLAAGTALWEELRALLVEAYG